MNFNETALQTDRKYLRKWQRQLNVPMEELLMAVRT